FPGFVEYFYRENTRRRGPSSDSQGPGGAQARAAATFVQPRGGTVMPFAQGRHLAVDSRTVGVKVVRFDGPDLRDWLQDDAATDGCALYREIQSSALANLKPGELLVVNLGPIEVFTPAFLSLLLNVRYVVRQRLARLVLCELREQQRELLEVTKTL